MENNLPTLTAAISFAAQQHENQRRKNASATPYINHPIDVMDICAQCGIADAEILSAAVLHDVIEDTDANYEELCERFGERIADMVRECSDDKSLTKVERKKYQIVKSASVSDGAKIIKCADKISNLSSLLTDPPRDWSSEQIEGYFVWSHACWKALEGINASADEMLGKIFEQCGLGSVSQDEMHVKVEKYYEYLRLNCPVV